MPAGSAVIDMSAQCRGTATLDGRQHFQMKPVQPMSILVNETASCKANQIGHAEWWRGHYSPSGGSPATLMRVKLSESSGLGVACNCFVETWR